MSYENWHGTPNGYGWHRCRDTCCRNAASARRRRLRRARRAERVLIDGRLVHPKAPHGTAGGMQNWGCQCDPCRTANSVAAHPPKVSA